MKNMISILTLVMFLLACEKEHDTIIAPPAVIKKEFLERVWIKQINNGKGVVGTDYTEQYKNLVLATGDLSDPFTIYAFDKVTGEKVWRYYNDLGKIKHKISNAIVYQNLYIGITGIGIVAVNLDNQQLAWEVDFAPWDGFLGSSLVIRDGYLYHFITSALQTTAQSSILLKIDLSNGKTQVLLNIPSDSIGVRFYSPPVFYDDPTTGRTLMICNHYPNWDDVPQSVSQYLVARDLATMEIVWSTHLTDTYGGNSLFPPVISGDIVMTGSSWFFNGLDARTGKIKWRTPIPGYTRWDIWTGTGHLVQGDRVYVNPKGFPVTCIEIATGRILWSNPEGGPNCTPNMLYQDGMLVFTSWGYGSVMFLDGNTGAILHRERPLTSNSDDTYSNNTIYDPVLDMYFTTSYRNVVAFKLKK